MFDRLSNGIDKNAKPRIRMGVCAMFSAIWNCRNDVVFNNAKSGQFLHVIHRATKKTSSSLDPEKMKISKKEQ